MTSIKKAIGFGALAWLVPFILSFAFFTPNGEVRIDIFLFKSIIIVIATMLGALLLVNYFKKVTNNFLKEGISIGLLWFTINIALDLVILLPMSKMALGDYITQIGLRYLIIPIMSIAFGMILNNAKNNKSHD